MPETAPVSGAIRSLTLSSFRSHAHTTIDCTAAPPAVVLCGANGTGKTSILEAISMFGVGRGLRGGTAEEAIRTPDAAGWHVRARLAGTAGAHVLEAALQPEPPRRLALLDGERVSRARLASPLRILWLTPAQDRVWTDPPAERRRLLDRIAAAFAPEHGIDAIRYERAMRERNLLLREGSRDDDWLGAVEARMAGPGAAIARRRVKVLQALTGVPPVSEGVLEAADLAILPATGRLPSGSVPEAGLADDSSRDEDRLRAVWRDGRGRDAAAGRTLEGPHRADLAARVRRTGTALRTASTGEQKSVLLWLMLAAARILARTVPVALLLDEAAAHLDRRRRAALCAELRACGAQLWLTGTDPALFAALGDDGSWFGVTKNETGESSVTRTQPPTAGTQA